MMLGIVGALRTDQDDGILRSEKEDRSQSHGTDSDSSGDDDERRQKVRFSSSDKVNRVKDAIREGAVILCQTMNAPSKGSDGEVESIIAG